jgi:hypothetical protein
MPFPFRKETKPVVDGMNEIRGGLKGVFGLPLELIDADGAQAARIICFRRPFDSEVG